MAASADRNLLFGVLALQMDFVTQDALVAAMRAWVNDKNKPLAQILLEQGGLGQDVAPLLDSLVQKHIDMHGGDVEKSLAAVRSIVEVRRDLEKIDDADLHASLAHVLPAPPAGPDPYVTRSSGEGELSSPPSAVSGSEDPYATREFADDDTAFNGIRYRHLRPHKAGGLGQVYVALDRELHREVALKEIKPKYVDDNHSRERFVLEAEVTGMLEHPGVVPVYGLGRYKDGRPYYAMRFIKGESLKDSIKAFHDREKDLPAGERELQLRLLLRRFVDVCNAVAYAHSRGVLHRDIKPANIMLGPYGESLVVDWGLAKLVGQAESERKPMSRASGTGSHSSPTPTLYGSTVGTPGFMSPEQGAGRLDQLGPASDVYSLGATLYCLLTGRVLPFADGSKELGDILDRVQRGDFPRPSAVKPGVPRALEAICLKAMSLAAADRYPCPTQLADDIEHWMADEPVTACPETWSERLGRWMRRHRSRVVAAVVALLVVSVVSVAAAFIVNEARRNEHAALEKAEKSLAAETAARGEAMRRFKETRSAVDTWLTDASEALKHHPSVQKTRQRLLQKAAEDYERFVREAGDALELRHELGRAYYRLGDVRRLLGEWDAAEKAYRTAEATFDGLVSAPVARADHRLGRAISRTKLGVALANHERHGEAEKSLQAAVTELKDLHKGDAASQPIADALGSGLFNYGVLLSGLGRYDEGRALLQEAIRRFEDLARADRDNLRYRFALATARCGLGQVLAQLGSHRDAVDVFRDGVTTFAALIKARADHPDYLEGRAAAQLDLANTLRPLGHEAEEVELYRGVMADYAALAQALPDVIKHRASEAITRVDLGQVLTDLGRSEEARRELEAAAGALAELMKIDSTAHRGYWATARLAQGVVLSDLQRDAEAERALQDARDTFQKLIDVDLNLPLQREQLAVSQGRLGLLWQRLGKPKDARVQFEKALGEYRTLMKEAPGIPAYRDGRAAVANHLGDLHSDEGRSADAALAYREALEVRAALAHDFPDQRYLCNHAWLLANCLDKDLRDARLAIVQARKACEKAPDSPRGWNALGVAHYRAGDWKEAIDALDRAVKLRPDGDSVDGFFLAMAYQHQGAKAQADAAYQGAVKWMEKNRPGNVELRRLRSEAARVLGAAKPK